MTLYASTIGYSDSRRGDPCQKTGNGWRCPPECNTPRHRGARPEPVLLPCGHPSTSRLIGGDGHTRCAECRASYRAEYNAKRRERNAA